MIEEEQLIRLGTTDLMVSRLGLGTWAWGDRFYWGFGRGEYSVSDLEEAFEVSVAGGINFFDTAEVYGIGKSERFLGSFIENYRSNQETAEPNFVVATKFFPYPWRFLSRNLDQALNQSKNRLNLSAIDLYQTHWPWPPRSIETWVKALANCARSGLIRAIGVSNYNLPLMERAKRILSDRGSSLSSNQVEFNLLQRGAERSGLLGACLEAGITLIAYSPLASGVLTGKYSAENPPPGPRGRRYGPSYLSKLGPLFDLMGELSLSHGGVTFAQIALNWVISKGAVPIPGAKTGSQARENLGGLGWRLAREEVRALDACSDRIRKDVT